MKPKSKQAKLKPYAFFFKLYFTESKTEGRMLNQDEYDSFVKEYTEKSIHQHNFENVIDKFFQKFVLERLNEYFDCDNHNNVLSAYYSKITKQYFDEKVEPIEKIFANNIYLYLKDEFKNDILSDPNFINMFIEKKSAAKDDNGQMQVVFKSVFFDRQIKINFKVPFETLCKSTSRYFSKNIFNVPKFNQDVNNKQFGLSNFFNKAAEDKKIFNLHRTAFFKPNILISEDWGLFLNEFLNASTFLPKTLPIFIDKSELNAKVVTIFKNDGKKGYKAIMSDIAKNHEEDLQNYYLINFNKNEIKDLDFVSFFKFKQRLPWSNETIKLFFQKVCKTSFFKKEITNIFDIEEIVRDYFFYGKLNYFGYLKKNESTPDFLIVNFYKYNKLLYDAFYKSLLSLITPRIFNEICLRAIKHDIIHDESSKNEFSKNHSQLKMKIVLYIHLNQLFDLKHQNFGGVRMTAKLPYYYQKTKSLMQNDSQIDEDVQIDSDELWAFATGQLIFYLLTMSKSSNKSHAMFEPFLRKFNNVNDFKKQIALTFQKYKHEIDLKNDRFNQLAAKVIDYSISNKNLQKFEAIVYSGYFARSLFYESKKGEKNDND